MAAERTSSIHSLSDEELYLLLKASCNREHLVGGVPSMDNGWHAPIWRISPDAVVKRSTGLSEVHTMQFVRNNTSIPIPAVRRALPVRDAEATDTWIVMDYIEGNTLFELWDTLTDERKRDIFDVLGRYVRELRSVPLPNPSIPGPLHPDGIPQICNACFFSEDEAGPFNSYQEMADWFDRQRLRCRIYIHKLSNGHEPVLPCPKFDATHPLVLCHMDIHPRNVIVDGSGTLWLLDWGFAGAYPPWFEYGAIAVPISANYKCKEAPAWRDFAANASTIAGDYARYYDDYLHVLFEYTMGMNFDNMGDVYDIPDDYFEKLGIAVD